jgi:predicted metal-binding membrane protein
MSTATSRRFGVSPYDSVFLPILGGVVAVAWAALAVWSASPYARYVDHDWTQAGIVARLCAAVPGGDILLQAFLYVLGWVLMTTAMMLPTAMPLLRVFGRLVGRRADAGRLLAIAIGGYLSVWLGFGVAAHLFGLALVALAQRSLWLTFNGWAIGAALLFVAGLFQFSRLKYLCLDACGAPLGFVATRWRARRPALESFQLGVEHGLFCVGCCWALTLLLFAVGTGSIGWMAALGGAMAIEKNAPWGRRLARPLGVALLTCAVAITAVNLAA